jgi:hypothetical protein
MTLREALKVVLDDESLEDKVYDVRSRAVEGDPDFSGNSWDHPRVTRFGEACQVLRGELKRLDEEAAR